MEFARIVGWLVVGTAGAVLSFGWSCGGETVLSGDGGGGAAPAECDCDFEANEVCVYADGLCGEGAPKSCQFMPPTCGESPVSTYCGCDGEPRAGTCVMQSDARPNACPAPQGQFWCGEEACGLGESFCQLDSAAVCAPLPADCLDAAADCDCFGTLGDACTCTQREDGHFDVSCQPF